MDDAQLDQMLAEVQAAWKRSASKALDYYFGQMHLLAEAEFSPAKDFFISCLDDPRSDWREFSLKALGFHYNISNENSLIQRIRTILLNDPDSDVRMVAASVLGAQSRLPEQALVQALENDPDTYVNFAAFSALLTLMGFSPMQEMNATEKIKREKESPSSEDLKKVISEFGGNPDLIFGLPE